MSLALLLFESGRTGSTMLGELCQFKFNLPFLIPAAIYTCTNNLSFLIYERLDPGSECFDDCQVFSPLLLPLQAKFGAHAQCRRRYLMRGCIVRAFDGPHSLAVSIVWNLKICTTALALRCCLGRHLHWMQWLAIGALTCGVIISQEDKLEEGWAHPPALPSAAGASSPHPNRKLVGLLFCLASIASVTVANVLCEHLYKRPPKSAMSPLASMYSRNCSLYFFGVVCNLMALCFRSPPGGFSLWPSDWQLRDTFAHLFDGYNGFVAGPSADSRAWEALL
jgi:hypothetical protein